MPLRMCIAGPVGLAALAVLAIGLISYNIIANKRKKVPLRGRRTECTEDFKTDYKSCVHPDLRRRRSSNSEVKSPSSENTESKKQDNLRKESQNRSSPCRNETYRDISCGSSGEKESSFNNLDSLAHNEDENSKLINIIPNINQEDIAKLEITKTVIDEDAESTVSNASVNGGATSLEYQTPEDNPEKLYKKEVSQCLRSEVETMSHEFHADYHPPQNEDDDDLCNFRDFDNSGEKPVICRGCEESYANAVAHPCGHRYLCLDCAIKVHRIYQKCTVCSFHIETYDIYDSRAASV